MLLKHPTPNVTILEKNIFYDSKIDLTPIFILKNRNSKKYCFYCFYGQNRVFFTNCREWNVDRSLWQSVNASLSSYVPSFRHAISLRPDHATIFPRCCHVFEKKSESNRAALFFESGEKKRKGNCFDKDWTEKHAASDKGSYYKQNEFEEGILWHLEEAAIVPPSHMKLLSKTVQDSDDDNEVNKSEEFDGKHLYFFGSFC